MSAELLSELSGARPPRETADDRDVDAVEDSSDHAASFSKGSYGQKEEEAGKDKMGAKSSRVEIPVNDAETEDSTSGAPEYRVFKKRWLLLLTVCVLNFSNGTMWLTYSPIPNLVADFYHISVSDVDWFSTSYFVTSLVVGFISIAILDVYGLRLAMFLGAGLNLIGAILRFVSSLQPVVCFAPFPKLGFAVAMVGQILTACGQPFFLYSPTKLANTWFSRKERDVCTGLVSMANVVGLATSQLLAPQIVQQPGDLNTLLWILIIPAGFGAILSLSFYRDRPPVPPASSGDIEAAPFFKGLKATVKNVNFLVLLVAWGCGAGVFNALLIILPQYLCPNGYSNSTVGIMGAVLIFCGLAGAIIAGLIVGWCKKYKEMTVISYGVAILCIIWAFEVGELPGQTISVFFSFCVFGFFALALLPLCMEMGVEVTYPVAEATSSGLLWSAAQVFGMVFLELGQLMTVDVPPEYLSYSVCETAGANNISGTCSGSVFTNMTTSVEGSYPQYWTNAGYFLLAVLFVGFTAFVAFFKPRYNRLLVDLKAQEEERMRREGVGIANGAN